VARLGTAEALVRLLRSLNVDFPASVTDPDELAARFRSAVADRRLLLLLDDAADAAQVTPLLPGGANCGVLVTSRNTLAQLDGAAVLRLDVLSRPDALRLFQRLTGRAESAAVVELVELCGRVPLAICVAAARLNTDPRLEVPELVEQLRPQSRRLEHLDDGQRAVRSTFMVSYDNLDADAAALFRRLGLHEGDDFSTVTAAAAADVPPERAETLLASLVAAHLIEPTAPGRHTMHDLLRLFSRERAAIDEPEPERRRTIERILHAYLATARNALRAFDIDAELRCDVEPLRLRHDGAPIADDNAAFAWGRSEMANLAAGTRQAVAAGHPRIAVALVVAALPTLYSQGYWNQVYALCRTAIPAVEGLDSRPHRAHILRDSATVELSLGLFDAGLEHATGYRETCTSLGDAVGQAWALNLQGTALRNLRRFEESIECLRESLAVSERLPVGRQRILTWIKLGLAYVQTRRLAEAGPAFERAATLAEQHGDYRNRISAISNLAYLRRESGDCAAAVSTFEDLLILIRQTALAGALPEADALWGLGDSLCDLDRRDEAARHWSAAAEILAKVGLITETERREITASDRPEMPRVLR
jgi:tetratricopeptide (TPR) repeat protein